MDWDLLPIKAALVSVIWVQWKKVATSAIDDVFSGEKKAHTATTKLMFYVMGSIPILQAILFCSSPSW
jgi:hypothetical protein